MFKRILQAFRGAATETPTPSPKNPLDRERARLLRLGVTPEVVTATLCLREILPDAVGYNCSLFGEPFAPNYVFGYPGAPVFLCYPHATVRSGINDNGAREARAVREYARLRKNGYSDEEIAIIRKGRELWSVCKEIAPYGKDRLITEMVAEKVLELINARNLGASAEPTPPAPGRAQAAAPRRGLGD